MEPVIRAGSEADGAACAAIYAPYVRDTAITFELEPPAGEEMAARIAAASVRHSWLVLEHEGAVIGYAHAGPHNPRAAYDRTATTGIYLATDQRGQGFGRQLYAALLSDLAARGFHVAIAIIALPNAASEALHRKLGFARVGTLHEVGWKFGTWHDTGWWQRLL
jgi:phosphinothricin acetyltransferase